MDALSAVVRRHSSGAIAWIGIDSRSAWGTAPSLASVLPAGSADAFARPRRQPVASDWATTGLSPLTLILTSGTANRVLLDRGATRNVDQRDY